MFRTETKSGPVGNWTLLAICGACGKESFKDCFNPKSAYKCLWCKHPI